MNLPNTHFTDFPIEFKEINPEDFPAFEVGEKIIISPNEEGFINEPLQDNIDLEEKNTIIVNAAVGQGKTYSIIDIIKRYYDARENYLIVVAVPYVSLVQQYLNDIVSKGIPESDIYRYEYIGIQTHIDAWNSKIQIITVNGLLGNPGEDSPINDKDKRIYINYLSQKCLDKNRKVVFIYDEIHDTIHNFKEKYIFNLWKWKNVIHKNIILSATYNEASKIVIEYLAELTDSKLKIIESKRTRIPSKQSDLFLHFNKAKFYKEDNDGIYQVVKDLISEGKQIDILSFSKKLAINICSNNRTGIGKLLFEQYGEIKKCVSDMVDNESLGHVNNLNKYDSSKCNVGTNFKTGISIEKENHAFVIIMPSLGARSKFKNKFGIFTDGINSIIQALARQRKKGEIHIILYPPDKFNFDSLPFSVIQKNNFKSFYENLQSVSNSDPINYLPINSQNSILENFYFDELMKDKESEIIAVNNIERPYKVRLDFPEFKLFKMNDGEKYLTSKYFPFFRDLSSFITYSAITNQFINCNLTYVNAKAPIFFKQRKIQWKLDKFYDEYIDEDLFNSLFSNVSDTYKYFEFKNRIFKDYNVKFRSYETGEYSNIQSLENKEFEKHIIAFIYRKLYPLNRELNNRFLIEHRLIDADFTRGDYFLACISHSNRLLSVLETLPIEMRELVSCYQSLDYFRNKIIGSIQTILLRGGEVRYISSRASEDFFDSEELSKFQNMIQVLVTKDYFISNEIFDFKNNFQRIDNSEITGQINSFYNYLKADFLKTESRRINNSKLNENVSLIIEILDVPNPNLAFDFITSPQISIPEENVPTYIILDGKLTRS